MCGITGVLNYKGENPSIIEKMTMVLKHRGPDAQRYIQEGNNLLGHTRLSILDLSEKSNQPYYSSCGNYVMVFNGEIYNYLELKESQFTPEEEFLTGSDTEVLLKLLIHKGKEAISLLNGMFAFCFIDLRTNESIIARDRLGIKPLYYATTANNQFIFSSEVKSILASELIEKKLNYSAIPSYLSYRYVMGNESFFEGVLQLEPGHVLSIDSFGKIHKEKYWQLEVNQKNKDEAESIDELRTHFDAAVKRRMIADVEVGAFLSGGVDSSGVVATMKRLHPNANLNTYTIGFKEDKFNEFSYANQVAKQYDVNHTSLLYSMEEYWGDMEQLIDYKDGPLGVPNEPALYKMSKTLRKDFTVVLSGEGADEIFGGYGRIFRGAEDFNKLENFEEEYRKQRYPQVSTSPFHHFIQQYKYVKQEDAERFFSPHFLSQYYSKNKGDQMIKELFDQNTEMEVKTKYMYIFEKLHLPGLLQRVDCTSMAASIEARVPFVDHELVNFAFEINPELKLKWNSEEDKEKGETLHASDISEILDTPKYILKKAFEDRLNDSILYRKKMGFPMPLHLLFTPESRERNLGEIEKSILAKEKLINLEEIINFHKEIETSQNSADAQKLWMILNLSIFLNKHF